MKLSNEYVENALSGDFYEKTPKAVFAALAVSLILAQDENFCTVEKRLKDEWEILFENGIVPQKPLKTKR